MKRRWSLVVVVPVLLAVAGCAPAVHIGANHPIITHHTPSASPSTSPSATPAATPSATPAPSGPVTVNAADYLVDGTPHHPDANGDWFGEWAFYTDATKSVWCQITIFSSDGPGANCSIVPAARSQVTYPLPAGSSAGCATSDWDGYTLGLAASVDDLIPKDAGWDQCYKNGVAVVTNPPSTKVLPDGDTLTVSAFSCTVHSGVATCSLANPGTAPATITLGLHTASFHSN